LFKYLQFAAQFKPYFLFKSLQHS